MKELHELKELYLDEIKKVNKKGDLTPSDHDAVKKSLETIKMIDEICEMDSGSEYSERSYRRRSYRMPEMDMRDGYYRRGRYSRRNATADMMIEKLEDLLRDAPDMETREAIECALDKLERY